MQYFKENDQKEIKMVNAAKDPFDLKSLDLDDFYEGCYSAFPLGDILWDDKLSPLANAIPKDIFRQSFPEVFQAFTVAGSFESYLTVFSKIFGEDATVTFTVPAPGRLQIEIEAAGVELTNFISREIEDNTYVFSNMKTQDDEQIVFQSIKGFQSQYDLEQMLFEMVPDGIFTEITLTLGV